ncbi:MAG: hypothetical protein ACYTBJ_00990 [Planctomycetota bacterium]|jgi:hypothetical protein
MGATTFFMYEQDRLRAAEAAGKKKEAEDARKEMNKRQGKNKKLDEDGVPEKKEKKEKPEPKIIDPADDKDGVKVDLDGDGKADVIIKDVK